MFSSASSPNTEMSIISCSVAAKEEQKTSKKDGKSQRPFNYTITHTINQSINRWSTNQPINQSTVPSINQSINHSSTNQPINQSINQLTNESNYENTINQSIDQWIVLREDKKSNKQSIKQPLGQSIQSPFCNEWRQKFAMNRRVNFARVKALAIAVVCVLPQSEAEISRNFVDGGHVVGQFRRFRRGRLKQLRSLARQRLRRLAQQFTNKRRRTQ